MSVLASKTDQEVREIMTMGNVQAIEIIEGITPVEDESEVLEAWQHVMDSGLINHLQGSYQAAAYTLVAAGLITTGETK